MSPQPRIIGGLRFEIYDPLQSSHVIAAQEICAATAGQPMLELTGDDLGQMPMYVLAYDGERLVGGRGLTVSYGEGKYEMGGLVSTVREVEEYKGQHIGTRIAAGVLKVARDEHPDAEFIVVSNPASAHINGKLGGTAVTNLAELPPALFDFCKGKESSVNPKGRGCHEYEKACALGVICCEIIRGGSFFRFLPKSALAANAIAEQLPE